MEVEADAGVIYHKTEYRERRNHFAFFACSEPLAGFDTQREAFLGPYRGWDRRRRSSAARRSTRCSRLAADRLAPCRLTLAPGESRAGHLRARLSREPARRQIRPAGLADDQQTHRAADHRQVSPIRGKSSRVRRAATLLGRLLDIFQVNTPDEHTNRMVNIWNAYQCMITFNMSRSASYLRIGIGRGMGFRDSNQDLLGFVHMVPERARERILDLAATQLPDGGAYHQYQPLTKRGNNDVGTNFNDDPLWLVLAVAAYLKETGDWTILDDPTPYDNNPAPSSRSTSTCSAASTTRWIGSGRTACR